MSTWRQFAEEVQRENKSGANRDNRDDSAESGPNGPIVPNVPAPSPRISESQARSILRHWHGRISRLDDTTAPAGWTFGRWVQRVDDACFVYQHFASRAVRDGWSAFDLFGIMVGKPGWGGLVDRLRGARDLKMGADRAAWTVGGIRERFCRGGSDDLRADVVLLWEVGVLRT